MKHQRPRRQPVKTYRANVADIMLSGTGEQIISKLEALGYEAERMKNETVKHTYFQAADHYKRMNNDGQCRQD